MRGITIIELMLATASIGILAAWAYPKYRDLNLNLTLNEHRAATIEELAATLTTARREATKQSLSVIVCPTTNNRCSSTNDWTNGWISFVDVDGNATYDAGTDTILRQYRNPYSDLAITIASSYSPPGISGTLVMFASLNRAGSGATIRICDRRGSAEARSVNVATTGQVEASLRRSVGPALDISGAPLSCP